MDCSQEVAVSPNAKGERGAETVALRNPPDTDSHDDLAALHYLNEPSGVCAFVSIAVFVVF
jgi:myosin heavy subunit